MTTRTCLSLSESAGVPARQPRRGGVSYCEMKIAVVGTGYVGLVLGACLAENGNNVICVDKDPSKVSMLQAGRMPIYEPGLEELVRRNRAEDRLQFTMNLPTS